ncbi:MAG: trimethylamine methyltransferase family protein [Candidatus Zipacnadales bacterium]
MKLRVRLEVALFSADELEAIASSAIRLFSELPLRIQGTDELFDYLRDFGCRIDGERVYFPPSVRSRVLDRIREEKRAWLESHGDAPPPWPDSDISVYTHGQALLACDLETNELRPATHLDLEEWCRVVDALGIPTRSHPTFIPTDFPVGCADFLTFATIILNSKRPHRVSVYSAQMLPFFIEACAIAKGSHEAVRQEPEFATTLWVTSPFMITRENVKIAMDARRLLGRPLVVSTMPVAGAATPVTVAGQAALTTAEALALNAVTLAVDDRTCGIMHNPLVMDMRVAHHRQSGPDVVLHRTAAHEMHRYFFGGHPRLFGFSAGAQVVGPQALLEKGMGMALEVMSGTRSLGIGCLAASDVGSLVQLTLDYEMAQAFQHLLREIQVDAAHIGEDAIRETVPQGARFMEIEHTARFYREELWMPMFLDFRPPLGWERDPSDIIQRARKYARNLAKTAENQCPLSGAQRQAIQSLMNEARRISGGETR